MRCGAVSRGLTWAATSVPEIRRQWCNALDATAERHSEPLLEPPSGPAAKRIERMQEKTAAAIEVMKVALAARRSAELYWVARNHVAGVLCNWSGEASSCPLRDSSLATDALRGRLSLVTCSVPRHGRSVEVQRRLTNRPSDDLPASRSPISSRSTREGLGTVSSLSALAFARCPVMA